ncbi:MAG: MFS transporter [Chroococcidiopsidaceae cyanobacterium CP_BM_ER_R8_30]|nr:MFS transporter [Chroococcidiopsidaceae cyanobacterium CP_BM_ER_R8_30]
MFQMMGLTSEIHKALFWLAQVPRRPVPFTAPPLTNNPEDASVGVTGPHFWIAWISGVLLAFAIQLVLTNFAAAFGLSFLGRQSDSDSDSQEVTTFGGTVRKIGVAVGLGTLVSVTFSLAIASYLAVKLSLIYANVFLGAIVGLVIWATYFALLYWFLSRSVGSVVGSVVNTATSGLQAITGTLAAALGAKAASNQVVATAEAAAAAVRRELGSAIDPGSIRESIEDYVKALRPPELDISKIRSEFEKILNTPEVKEIAGSGDLRNINRQKFVDLVSSRTDLSQRDLNRIVDQLESVWRQVVGRQSQPDRLGELVEYLKSVQPGQLNADQFNQKLDQLIAEVRSSRDTEQRSDEGTTPGFLQQMLNPLIGIVLGRVDLSDLDVEKILTSLSKARSQLSTARSQLSTARDKATEQANTLAGQLGFETEVLPYNTVRADVENYLLNSYSWQMTREKVAQEFSDVLYDPEADPRSVRSQIEQLSKNDFVEILQQRGLFTQARIQEIADQLEAIRQQVLAAVTIAADQETTREVRSSVERYLLMTPKAELTPEGIQQNLKPLLEDSDVDSETLNRRLAQFDNNTIRQILGQRLDITPQEAESIIAEVENTRNRVVFESQALAEQARQKAETLWLNLESYLRNTGKDELNPEGIKRDLQTLLDDPEAGLGAIRARLSRFDRDTLVQLLSQRQDLSEEQVNQVLNQVEEAWNRVRRSPQALAGKAKEQYDQVSAAISDYLRNTGKDELNPEGIRRDLTVLLENPRQGALLLRSRLAQIDRDTLVKLLSQRQDLSEEQINQVIDQVELTLRNIVRSPRRLAARTQARVQTFRANLEDYLRNTGKDELNPEGIKRDLQLLLNDPRAGLESFGDRLSQFDRATVVALLQARPDMSEEEANRIVDQVLSVRDSIVEQVRGIQRRIQDVIEGVFANIRNYLNSLDRPELNYDGISRDVRQLFNDPQAGFDALRDRLGSFNRDTLVAVMSSREDISEADANRIVDRIEGARNSVLQRAESVQQEAQRRLEEVKRQAQRQAQETRKAAAAAAWWLAATAVVSAAFSGAFGAIAVITA